MKIIDWIRSHAMELGVIMMIAWSIYFMVVGGLWMMGYLLNGFYGMHFEIASCWAGLGCAVGAIPTVWTVIKGAVSVYRTDSELNTKVGDKP